MSNITPRAPPRDKKKRGALFFRGPAVSADGGPGVELEEPAPGAWALA